MKKFIIAALLVLTVFTASIFADNPSPASFDVTTTIGGINLMKITAAEFTGTTLAAFNSASAFSGSLPVNTSGTQTFSAWLSTISNRRTGFTVSMVATPMTSSVDTLANAYIDYTVSVNSESFSTNGATTPVAAVNVIEVTSLAGLTAHSYPIGLTVDANTFDAAVEGSYTGTVTFTYTAN